MDVTTELISNYNLLKHNSYKGREDHHSKSKEKLAIDMFIFFNLSPRASRCSLKFISLKLVYRIKVSLIILSFYFFTLF